VVVELRSFKQLFSIPGESREWFSVSIEQVVPQDAFLAQPDRRGMQLSARFFTQQQNMG
jgi:hypothetical protein